MSGASSAQDIFDVRRIRRLVELMKEHDLSEIDIRDAQTRIRIRRGGDLLLTGGGVRPMTPAAVAPAAAVAGPAPSGAPATTEEEHTAVVKSPMVGTFYTAPDPDSAPFVKVGDHVGPETTVCIVEAMKVFNQIPAEVAGKVLAVLVENGQSVEFGQPLFKVDTRA
jgi:acetyl-CoA carboxylase biotin carboxyl carrier protein